MPSKRRSNMTPKAGITRNPRRKFAEGGKKPTRKYSCGGKLKR